MKHLGILFITILITTGTAFSGNADLSQSTETSIMERRRQRAIENKRQNMEAAEKLEGSKKKRRHEQNASPEKEKQNQVIDN